jgi:exodeoxyribonuclease VII small subunit
MAKAPSPPPSALPATYEEAQAELTRLVARLEGGDMPLEDLLTGYQRGAELLKFCRARLQAVEDQIKVLDAQGLKTWAPRT